MCARKKNQELTGMIFAAAEELFLAEGYRSVSMRKIANKIGYSATTIYNYFEDKADLLQALVQEYYKDYLAEAEIILKDEDTDPLGTLKKMLSLYVYNGLKHPNHYKLLIGDYPEMVSVNLNNSEGFKSYQNLLRLVEKCIANGAFKKQDAVIATQGLWCAVYGVTSLLTIRPGFPWADKDKLIDQIITSSLTGLK